MKIKGGWSYEDRKRWIIFCDISRKQVWKELSCMPSLFIRTVIVVVAANNETGSYRGKAYTPLSAVSQKILVTQIINRMENLTRIPRPLSMARDRFALFAATRSAVKRCHVYVCVCVHSTVPRDFVLRKRLYCRSSSRGNSASFLIIVTLINFQEYFNGPR